MSSFCFRTFIFKKKSIFKSYTSFFFWPFHLFPCSCFLFLKLILWWFHLLLLSQVLLPRSGLDALKSMFQQKGKSTKDQGQCSNSKFCQLWSILRWIPTAWAISCSCYVIVQSSLIFHFRWRFGSHWKSFFVTFNSSCGLGVNTMLRILPALSLTLPALVQMLFAGDTGSVMNAWIILKWSSFVARWYFDSLISQTQSKIMKVILSLRRICKMPSALSASGWVLKRAWYRCRVRLR